MNLEDFKFGRTKITSLRIVDETSPELQSIMSNWTKLAYKLNMMDVERPVSILVRSKGFPKIPQLNAFFRLNRH